MAAEIRSSLVVHKRSGLRLRRGESKNHPCELVLCFMHVKYTVIIPDAFQGPRHERCKRAWARVQKESATPFNLVWVPREDGEDHYEMLDKGWELAAAAGTRYVVLTEADFLPDLTKDWLEEARQAMGNKALLACAHVRRVRFTWEAVQTPASGAWFLLFDMLQVDGTPDFNDGEDGQDPGTTLVDQFRTEVVFGGPEFFSMVYPWGCHLFWSRYFNEEMLSSVRGIRTNNMGYPLVALLGSIDALLTRWELLGRV